MEVNFVGSVEEVCREMAQFLTLMGYSERLRTEPLREIKPNTNKSAGKSKIVTAPQPEPQPEPQPQEEAEEVRPEAQTAVDALRLKNEQLDRLRDLFNAGKGTFVRELLAKYGEGAKVFPEVDAKHFAAIKAEIDRELH